MLNILVILGRSWEWNCVFIWEGAHLLKNEMWWNKTNQADWQGMIDNKDDIDPVLCRTMLESCVRKLHTIWKPFSGITRGRSRSPAIEPFERWSPLK